MLFVFEYKMEDEDMIKNHILSDKIIRREGYIEAANKKEAKQIALTEIEEKELSAGYKIDREDLGIRVYSNQKKIREYHSFTIKAKKFENYPSPLTPADYIDAFENDIIKELEKRGNTTWRKTCYGLEFSTRMDVWAIDIKDANDTTGIVTIWHANKLNANASDKRKNAKTLPGYHLQLTGKLTVDHILWSVYYHDGKYERIGKEMRKQNKHR